MKKMTTLGGSVFLVWLFFSPIIALLLYIRYEEIFRSHGGLLLPLGFTYLLFGGLGILLVRAVGQKFLIEDRQTKWQGFLIGIIYIVNMFAAGIEIIFRERFYANPIIGFVLYPTCFIVGSIILGFIWLRTFRAAVVCFFVSGISFFVVTIMGYFNIRIGLGLTIITLIVMKRAFPSPKHPENHSSPGNL